MTFWCMFFFSMVRKLNGERLNTLCEFFARVCVEEKKNEAANTQNKQKMDRIGVICARRTHTQLQQSKDDYTRVNDSQIDYISMQLDA